MCAIGAHFQLLMWIDQRIQMVLGMNLPHPKNAEKGKHGDGIHTNKVGSEVFKHIL